MTSARTRSPATTRVDAERQADERRRRVAGRKAEQHRPGKSREDVGDDVARRDAPPGSSQPRHLAEDDGRRASPSTPAQPQLRQHAVEPVRPLADLVEKQHVAGRRRERVRRAERRQQLRERAADQRPGAPRRAAASRGRRAPARPAARRSGCRRNVTAIVRRRPRASRPSIIAPWTDARPTLAAETTCAAT